MEKLAGTTSLAAIQGSAEKRTCHNRMNEHIKPIKVVCGWLLLAVLGGCSSVGSDSDLRNARLKESKCPGCAVHSLASSSAVASTRDRAAEPPGKFIASKIGASPSNAGSESAAPAATTITAWLYPDQRSKRFPQQVRFINQAGAQVLAQELAGKPLAVSFFYTRCDNPRKCPLIVATMARLQDELAKQGLENQVKLALVTYDPEYDSPARLTQFGTKSGLRFDAGTMMLQPGPAQKKQFFSELELAVNFSASGVNLHAIQLLLFDKQGRYVRSHHTLIWDNAKVAADLSRLAREYLPAVK